MSDSHTPTSAPAAPTAPAPRAPSFAERRAQQDAGPAPQPSSTPNPRSQHEPHWTDGKTQESRAVKAYEAADAERLEAARAQHSDQPAPGSQSGTGEKVRIGKYELSETEVGDLISTKAAEESRKLTLPASAQAYEPTLPADFVAPAGVEMKIDTQDPLFGQAQQFAHRHQLSQDQFSELLGIYGASKAEEQVFLAKARAAEAAKLGSAAQARVTAVQTFLKGQLGDELAAEVNVMLVTAGTVTALEKLMSRFSNQGGGAFSQAHRVAPDPAGTIPGYDQMTFVQRRAAQDALNRRR
jgi:hypothetical protein